MPVYWVINYTDYHDVDEDLRTAASYGGHYSAEDTVGIMDRNPSSNLTEIFNFVASSNMKNSLIIRIFRMSTKTLRSLLIMAGNG